MAATAEAELPAVKPKGGMIKSLLAGLLLAVALGGGSFFVVFTGMIALPLPERAALGSSSMPELPPMPVTAFVPLDPVVVTLGRGSTARQLALSAQLEVVPMAIETVQLLKPRILDVIGTYLRAVDASLVEDPAAMLRLRAQMLRRIQVVTGEGVVRDLLITEFILR